MNNPFKSLFHRKSKKTPSPSSLRVPKDKRKTILVYGIFPFQSNPINEDGKVSISSAPITYVTNREEAYMVVDRLIYTRHYEHYKLWCQFRSLPVGFLEDSWTQYAQNIISSGDIADEDKFTILELYYSPSDCASFLRMFCDCTPLLLPHENAEELKSYINSKITSVDHSDPGIPPEFKSIIDSSAPELVKYLTEVIELTIDDNIKKNSEKK